MAPDRRLLEAQSTLQRVELRQLGGMPRGLSDALRAWTTKQLDGAQAPVDRVAVLGEAAPQVLQQVWPELAAFLESAPSV